MIRKLSAGALMFVLAVSGCATDDPDTDGTASKTALTPPTPTPSHREPVVSAFRRFAIAGDTWEIEHFESMKDLVAKADVVFVGTVTDGHWGTEYRDEEIDESGSDVEVLRDLVYELSVDHVVSGNAVGPREGTVELVVDLVDPREVKLDPPIGEQAIFFLRRVGGPVPGIDQATDKTLLDQKIYRPVSSLGIVDEDGKALDFPLGGGADWAVDFLSLNWDDAISRLDSLAR